MTTTRAAKQDRPRTPNNPPGLRDLPFELPQKSAAEKQRARRIYAALRKLYPDAHCELTHANPHELLVATILSAQATDAGVNRATPRLFEQFPTPVDFASATPQEIEPYIRTIGLFRNKAKSVHGAMTTIVEEFGGDVPANMDDLLRLRGVARKTANVVLGNAFGINDGVCVDTHVMRLSRLYALAPQDANAQQIERHLMALFPRKNWHMVPHLLIFHGRRCSTARTKPEDDPIYVRFVNGATTLSPATPERNVERSTAKRTKRTASKSKRATRRTKRGTR